MKKFCRIFCLILLLCMSFAIGVPIARAAESTGIVNIAYLHYPDMYKEVGEETVGYAARYMKKISEKTGWNVKFVEDSLTDAERSILSGNAVNLYFGAQRTDEKEVDFEFSAYPILSPRFNLYVKTDSNISLSNEESLEELRIGIVLSYAADGTPQRAALTQFLDENGVLSYTIRNYSSTAAAQSALGTSVDAIAVVGYELQDSSAVRAIANLGVYPLYIMGANGSALIRELNAAQQEVMQSEPSFFSSLTNEYFPFANEIVYTAEEAAYIQNVSTVTVGQYYDRGAISSYDEANEKFVGINPDILQKLSAICNLNLVSRPIYRSFRPISVVSEGAYDLVMGVVDCEKYRNNSDLILTIPYMSSNMAVVMKRGSTFDATQKYKIGYNFSVQYIEDYIEEAYPDFTATAFVDSQSALQNVSNGKLDLTIEDVYVANHFLQMPKYNKLEIVSNTGFSVDYCMVARYSANPCLISILNKAITYMNEAEVNEAIYANTIAKTYKITATDIAEHIFVVIIAVAVFILLVIAAFMYVLMKKTAMANGLSDKNESLSDALEQERSANARNGKFLQYVGKQIETPVNTIIEVGAEAIKRQPSEAIKQDFVTIEKSAKEASDILKNLNNVSMVLSGNVQVFEKPLCLKKELEAFVEKYSQVCKDAGIDLQSDINLNDKTYGGDSEKINLVLSSVLSYVLDQAKQGSVLKISAAILGKWDGKVFVRFKIFCSECCWRSEETEPALFLPFENETQDSDQNDTDNAFDIFVLSGFVKILMGAIRVENKQNEGSTFLIDLPFAPIEEDE